MANVVQDPKIHPGAILGNFSKPDPLVTFKKDDIAFTMAANGSNATSQKSVTTASCFQPNGTCLGGPTTSKPVPIGGPCPTDCHSARYSIANSSRIFFLAS